MAKAADAALDDQDNLQMAVTQARLSVAKLAIISIGVAQLYTQTLLIVGQDALGATSPGRVCHSLIDL